MWGMERRKGEGEERPINYASISFLFQLSMVYPSPFFPFSLVQFYLGRTFYGKSVWHEIFPREEGEEIEAPSTEGLLATLDEDDDAH